MPRSAAHDGAVRALQAQWACLVDGFAGLDPAAPSRVAGWTVREVEAHLTATTAGLGRLLAAAAPGRADSSVAGWAAALPALAQDIDRDARAEIPDLARAVAEVLPQLADADELRVVPQRTGLHTVHDAVRFRLVEGVVHGLDVGIAADPIAQRIAVKALVEVLVARAPGHSVELRIPPYTAVQIVEGPRHTRGNPPNVVELGPVAFLELATGRTAWPDAVRDGRVRASGDRADLGALLPLMS